MVSEFLSEYNIPIQIFMDRVFVLDTVHSTNQYIIDHIANMKLGDVCITDHQTQGRGRYGKIWYAYAGKSICLSIYWELYQMLPTILECSIMISIVVASVLKYLGVHQIQIKWPNDLYVYKRKLGGILIEMITKINMVIPIIIGIGINLSMPKKYTNLKNNFRINYIDLQDIGVVIDKNVLAIILINTLRQKLQEFTYYGFRNFLCYWKEFDYLYNKPVTLLLDNGKVQRGIAVGIGEHGELAMNQSGVVCYYSTGRNVSIYMNS